jgi:hypothetical protein
LKPDIAGLETCFIETLFVSINGFGNQNIFQGGALLTDFQLRIALNLFELMVQLNEQFIECGCGKPYFFRQYQDTARLQTIADFTDQGGAFVRRNEL